jgi:fluoroquinolone transport system permease protein
MKRVAIAFGYDVRLQFRNGFYYAAGFVVVLFTLVLRQVPGLDTRLLMPGLILSNLVVNTYYFIAGLVLLEKDEGVIEALIVTPLRSVEYLASKSATLLALSLVENLAIVLLVHGPRFNPLPFILGLGLASLLFTLAGFLSVLRYRSINEFLLPSMLYVTVLVLPVAKAFGLLDSAWLYLHPMHAPLSLVMAGFRPIPAWEIIYGIGYSLVWIGLLGYGCLKAFHRFVIQREGVS